MKIYYYEILKNSDMIYENLLEKTSFTAVYEKQQMTYGAIKAIMKRDWKYQRYCFGWFYVHDPSGLSPEYRQQ